MSAPPATSLDPDSRSLALDLAVTAVVVRLRTGRRWLPDLATLPPALREPGACFVTLTRAGALLGCIGTLVPRDALGRDVARNASAAAFDDPRLPAVTLADVAAMDVHVSVLGPLEPLSVCGWDDLRRAVRPGTDGLLVEAPGHRGTLLPSVWRSLPDVEEFLDVLWRKAWLPAGDWPPGLAVHRYRTEEFGAPARDHHPAAPPGARPPSSAR
jgi:AmmeMemoRadiSam system protein A